MCSKVTFHIRDEDGFKWDAAQCFITLCLCLSIYILLVYVCMSSNDDIHFWILSENLQLPFQSVMVVDIVIIHKDHEIPLGLSDPVISRITGMTIIMKQPVYLYPLILFIVQ